MTSVQLGLSLPDPISGNYRKKDPQTSVTAAQRCRAGSQSSRILSTLAANLRGMTTEELERELGVVRNTISTRLKQMEKRGLVEAFGQRLNGDGNPMQVWYLRTGGTVDVQTGGRL